MRHRSAVFACFAAIVVAPLRANAQTSTVDGMKALVAGDYSAAARILRPLAEDPSAPDPLAQFFLAMLYNANQGVDAGEPQACGLFTRASAAGPLANQARAIAFMIRQKAPFLARMCDMADDDRLPPPVAFQLGPSHSVSVDRMGVTVQYGDASTRTTIVLGDQNTIVLPARYTALDVTRPVTARRHFIERFEWRVDTSNSALNGPSWILGWLVIEVINEKLVFVMTEADALTSKAIHPPTGPEATDAVRLRVGETGEAEWVITSPAGSRSGIVSVKPSK